MRFKLLIKKLNHVPNMLVPLQEKNANDIAIENSQLDFVTLM